MDDAELHLSQQNIHCPSSGYKEQIIDLVEPSLDPLYQQQFLTHISFYPRPCRSCHRDPTTMSASPHKSGTASPAAEGMEAYVLLTIDHAVVKQVSLLASSRADR